MGFLNAYTYNSNIGEFSLEDELSLPTKENEVSQTFEEERDLTSVTPMSSEDENEKEMLDSFDAFNHAQNSGRITLSSKRQSATSNENNRTAKRPRTGNGPS